MNLFTDDNKKKVLLISLLLNLVLLLCLFFAVKHNAQLRHAAPAEEPALVNVDTRALRDNAADYGVSLEYLQLALPDYMVYVHKGEYVFELLDDELERNSYDWSKLVFEGERAWYRDEAWPDACLGVDVSYFQKEIDWEKVAADGIEFALVRLGYRGYSEGALYEDELAAANLDGAKAAGLKVGAYFFSQAVTVEEAEAEAELALQILDGRQLDLPLAFDMEEIYGEEARTDGLTREEATEIAQAFCRRVKKGGYQPMIYGNAAWLAARVDRKALRDLPVWLAQYHYRVNYPYDFALWQYTATGRVQGIEGEVDLNICFDPEEL
ncbi:MAG: glycoside hydrolase family 25 protein [Firmicutes bacterium]|nr:glycoside hydrolase family 25 protein [Bacillota bacterium]